MAEGGGNLSRTLLGASGEVYDYNCSPCEESGVHKEALKYCDSCKLFYCKKCLGEHNKFPALRGHVIKEAKSQPKYAVPTRTSRDSAPATLLESCEHHPEEMIKMYCGEHDVVCCTVCIALDHRECKGIEYILNLAEDIRTSQEYINYVEVMKGMKTEYEEIKQSIQDEIMTMSKVKTDIIKEVKDFKRNLVSRIEELERKSLEKVNERYEQIAESMNATASDVDKLLDKVTSLVRELDEASEAQLFVRMKRMGGRVDEKRKIDKSLNNFEGLSFSLDEQIRNGLDSVDGLVTINVPFKIRSRKEYSITPYDDGQDVYSARDMTLLDDDTVAVACFDVLMRFSSSFDKLGTTNAPGQLWGICKTSRLKELAVTIRDKQTIQFVKYTAKTMSLTKSFTVGVRCKGICRRDDHLFVACGGGVGDNVQGHIRQYDMIGNLIRTFDTDNAGRHMFTSPRLVTCNSCTKDIYIADRDNGIVVLDKNGKLTGHLYNSYLKNACGICHTTGNTIFVSGFESFNIQQYDENFRYVGTVLNFLDEKFSPACIVLDEKKKQLLVSLEDHNKIFVYDIVC